MVALAEAQEVFPNTAELIRETFGGDPVEALKANSSEPLKKLEQTQKLVDRIAALGAPASSLEESVAVAGKAADALGTLTLSLFFFLPMPCVADLLEAAKNGDAAGVEKAAEKLAALQPKLVRTVRTAADTIADPNRRKKLFGAIDDLGL